MTICRAALPAMWRALKRGYQAEPRLLTVAFGLSLLAALPDALLALWLMLLANGVTSHDRFEVIASAIGLGVSAVGTWFLRVTSDRVQRRFRDRLTIALESHVARLQATVATIAHHERPEYLDRLAVLRDQVFVLDHMYMSLFSTCGWILRLGVTVVLLMSIQPCPRAARGLRAAHCADLDLAARGSSALRKSAAHPRIVSRGICSQSPPLRLPERKCASRGSEIGW